LDTDRLKPTLLNQDCLTTPADAVALAHPRLPFRVGVDVRSIIVEKIALNVGLAGLIQKVKLVGPQIRVVAFDVGIELRD
jgi:hypothetical protein